MKKNQAASAASVENIYKLDGRVPVGKAIPLGLQHVLAMFISNIVPVMIIAGVAKLDGVTTAGLVQCAMLVAGLGTLIQLYPVWKVGSGLPVVMGLSFTFLASMIVCAGKGYGYMIGAVIVGGCIEGVLGLTAKYWRRFIAPVVSACVVTTIGVSLLSVGITSMGGGSNALSALQAGEASTFGSWPVIVVAVVTMMSCLLYQHFTKGFLKQLNVLFGLVVGYILAVIFTLTGVAPNLVNFKQMGEIVGQLGVVNFPRLFQFKPLFDLGCIVPVVLVFLVSAAETIGDTTAVCTGGLGRDITEKEVTGSLACDGFMSAVSGGIFGCPPITSFSQNVGLVAMTKVVNRFTIMFGALTLILAGLFPPVGAFFRTLPDPVLGGCTIIMFGSILVSGVKMLAATGLDQRNTLIAAASFGIGIGVTFVPEVFNDAPEIIRNIFASNPVAGVFVVSMFLSLILPKHKDQKAAK